jgi:hypothetical protein
MTRELQIRSYGCIPSGKDRLGQVLAVGIVFMTEIPTEERLSSSSCGFCLVSVSQSLATEGSLHTFGAGLVKARWIL